MTMKWHGDKFLRDLKVAQDRRLDQAAQVVVGQAKRLLGVSGTGVMRGGVIVRAVKRTKKTIYGAFPSRPGEPPHKQWGNLRKGVTYEPGAPGVRRIGPSKDTPYGKFLELGTRRMKPRPWLRRSLAEVQQQIKQILGAPWKWNG